MVASEVASTTGSNKGAPAACAALLAVPRKHEVVVEPKSELPPVGGTPCPVRGNKGSVRVEPEFAGFPRIERNCQRQTIALRGDFDPAQLPVQIDLWRALGIGPVDKKRQPPRPLGQPQGQHPGVRTPAASVRDFMLVERPCELQAAELVEGEYPFFSGSEI